MEVGPFIVIPSEARNPGLIAALPRSTRERESGACSAAIEVAVIPRRYAPRNDNTGITKAWKGSQKETVETGKKAEYTVGVMNAQLANSYYWYRFTWHPSGWRGASL